MNRNNIPIVASTHFARPPGRSGATYLSLLIYRDKPKEPEVSDLKPTIPVVGVEPAFNPGHSDIADPSDEKAVSDLKPASPSLGLDPTNWKGTAMNIIDGLGAHHQLGQRKSK